MDRDVAGIRISPASVTFYDTVPENVEQLNVTVNNISKSSKSIRFYAPKTKVSILWFIGKWIIGNWVLNFI